MNTITLEKYLNANKRFYKECYLVNKYQDKQEFINKRLERVTGLIVSNTLTTNKTIQDDKTKIILFNYFYFSSK